jgi:hypothetical protein
LGLRFGFGLSHRESDQRSTELAQVWWVLSDGPDRDPATGFLVSHFNLPSDLLFCDALMHHIESLPVNVA